MSKYQNTATGEDSGDEGIAGLRVRAIAKAVERQEALLAFRCYRGGAEYVADMERELARAEGAAAGALYALREAEYDAEESEMSEAIRYVNRIKNDAKRRYATAYLAYRQNGGTEPDRGELSYIAAHAVRLVLVAISGSNRRNSDG